MHQKSLIIAAFYLLLQNAVAASSTTDIDSKTLKDQPGVQQANHIFNSVHSSMRQWGSALNHNGMSFFVAKIPASTELYHGRGSNETVKGLEWLAFEPEHAFNFARRRGPGGKPPGGPPGHGRPPPGKGKDRPRGPPISVSRRWPGKSASQLYPHRPSRDPHLQDGVNHDDAIEKKAEVSVPLDTSRSLFVQAPMILGTESAGHRLSGSERNPRFTDPSKDDGISKLGYLHTYAMRKELTVIYIDGESAAKTDLGTLDSQDYVLARHRDDDDELYPHFKGDGNQHGPPGEYERAQEMCNIAATSWEGRIDGFVRNEHGFELILCDFERSSDLVSIVRAAEAETRDEVIDGMRMMQLVASVNARYHGIGGHRVQVDYDSMVTAYAFEIDLFNSGEYSIPRLNDTTEAQATAVFEALTREVMYREEKNPRKAPVVDWQSVVDLMIGRYSDQLHEMAYNENMFSTKAVLDTAIELLLRPFTDYDNRNASIEQARCASHFMPKTFDGDSIPGSAIFQVSSRICETLAKAKNDETVAAARERVKELTDWLQWTTWKDCRPGCQFDEVCFTAIWPYGDIESHYQPYCVNASTIREGRGGESYWGGPW